MVLPFKKRNIPTTRGAVSTLLHALDIPKSEPLAAEAAVYSLLAEAPALSAVARDEVEGITSRFDLSANDIEAIGIKVLKDFLAYCLRDDALSQQERVDLKHLAAIFSIPAPLASRAVTEIGRAIFKHRLAEANADGEITADEQAKLTMLKTILGLSEAVPEVGVQWRTKFISEWEWLHKSLFRLNKNAVTAKNVLSDIARIRPDIAEHTNITFEIDELEAAIVESDELIEDIGMTIDSQQESESTYSLIVEAKDLIAHFNDGFWKRFHALTNDYTEKSKGPIIDPTRQWRNHAVKRQRENTTITTNHGFVLTGTPKQIAWANDIIAETVIGTPFYLSLAANAARRVGDESCADATEFLDWLQHRNAWWWIKVGQNSDLEAIYHMWLRDLVW
jgi:hypothetical protein